MVIAALFVPFDEASVLSSSKLLEAPEVVVEPVRVGDCTGDSLIGEVPEVEDTSKAFSFSVTASEVVLTPIRAFGEAW